VLPPGNQTRGSREQIGLTDRKRAERAAVLLGGGSTVERKQGTNERSMMITV
jgi:hypothetical protein